MAEFMYRFRPVKRLLGEANTEGELEGQYIYFASPEQLNDPLEGYKNTFFQGDNIIWNNLIKHYVRCLINSSLGFVGAAKNEIPAKNVNVFATASSANDELNKLNHDTYHKLVSESCVREFISNLAMDRKIRRGELLVYIQILHFYFIDIILESFYEYGLLTKPLKHFNNRAQALINIKNASDTIVANKTLSKAQELSFQKSQQRISERQLLTRYREDGNGHKYWFFLLFEFPEAFCRDIDRLMYPRWYTACFMPSCSDSSIWGSYGGYHQDVCLKFRTEKLGDQVALTLNAPNGEDRNGVTWGPVKLKFHEVSYEKSFVDIDFFRSIGHQSYPTLMETWFMGDNNEISKCAEDMFTDEESWRTSYWNNFYHSATVKLSAWNREKESRLIQTSMMRSIESSELRKLRYNFDSLEGIIFGINTTIENKLDIIKKVASLCTKFKRRAFNFYQARYDEHSREIMYHKLESINVGYAELPIDEGTSKE
jgi:hypothetical protein